MADGLVAATPSAEVTDAIRRGFRIESMRMVDPDGTVFWEFPSGDGPGWGEDLWGGAELEAHVPESILEADVVTREIAFASQEMIPHLSIVQFVMLNGVEIEQWGFTFGFVIPRSTNTWAHTLTARKGAMLSAATLSGNLVVVTRFFSGTALFGTASVRLWYDAPCPAAAREIPREPPPATSGGGEEAGGEG